MHRLTALFCVLASQIIIPSLHEGLTVLFESPKKINISFYRCDKMFHLNTILDMYDDENKIGVCLVSGEKILIYTVTITGNSHIDPILNKSMTIKLPNRQRKGGQSAIRFARNTESVRKNYVNIFTEHIVNSYMAENNTKCNISKFIIAGFGDMRNDIVDNSTFKQFIKKYLYKNIPLNSFDNSTIHSLVKNLIESITVDDSMTIDSEIINLIDSNSDVVGFGKIECLNLIELHKIKKLYVHTSHLSQNEKDLLNTLSTIDIIYTTSSQLELYGGWLCVKKYTDY